MDGFRTSYEVEVKTFEIKFQGSYEGIWNSLAEKVEVRFSSGI